jgi:Actin-like ATPase involved in cell division
MRINLTVETGVFIMSSDAGNVKKSYNKNNKKKVVKLENLEKLSNSNVSQKEIYNPDEVVFALDIGTRSVVGVVGIQEEDNFKVISTEVVEHKHRAMLDGQIHDIEQVAQVVKEVKDKIEVSLGIQLKKVSIAAAGRVLKTKQVRVNRDSDPDMEIDQEMISSLEIEGIQRAQLMLDDEVKDEEKAQFYCVGYSVTNYYLNGYAISKLNGHKGKTFGAEIIATFLPHIVVNSLYTVMDRVGLEVSSLTLEPIAAINVTIPPDLRLLNLALVDIGAGTSDIALTKDGSVVAYAMVPTAGDEITEAISQYYLVDFNTAEKIKIALTSGKEEISFSDILDIKHNVKNTEVLEVIKPTVELLADTISFKMLEINGKSPNAVFLIGGGSQVYGLAGMLAERLNLPKDRVVVRSRDVIKDVKFNDKKLSGPESITPYGIAITAQLYKGRDFLFVTVNSKKIKLFNSKKLTVADALILLGFDPGQLIGRSGKSLTYSLNGEKRLIRGEFGKAAEITVNDKPSNLETLIRFGDEINVIPAENGKDAASTLSDIINEDEADYIDDILVNGKSENENYQIKNSDIIEFIYMKLEDIVNPVMEEKPQDLAIAMDFIEKQNSEYDPSAVVVTINGQKIVLKEKKSQYIFVDVFNYISFDLTKPQGNIVLKLNGQPAAFTDIVNSGDIIEIFWQK